MKKSALLSIAIVLSLVTFSQKMGVKLALNKGQQIQVTTESKSVINQEVMGQTIDMNIDATIVQVYEVIDATANGTNVRQGLKRISMVMDGMGQQQTFDSDKKDDLDGEMGKPVKKMLAKQYEYTMDGHGIVTDVKADAKADKSDDEEADMMAGILKGVGSGMGAPEKGKPSFFSILPAAGVAVGDAWKDSANVEGGKEWTGYKVTGITDTEVQLDYTTTSTTEIKGNAMGMETVTNMKTTVAGKMAVDKNTGILKSKTASGESTGTIDIMGQSVPLTTKTTMTITVK